MRFHRILSSNLFRCSGLCVFVTVYLSLFIVAGIILFGSLFRIRRNSFMNIPNGYSDHSIKLHSTKGNSHYQRFFSSPLLHILDKWQNNLHTNVSKISVNDQSMNLFSKYIIDIYLSQNYVDLINCTSLQEVTDLEYIATGWTKVVYKGMFRGQDVAIKTVNPQGKDIQECQKLSGASLSVCYQRAAAKLLREIVLLNELSHENVVKVLGFCITETIDSVTLVTELGEPLDTIRLLQMSWEDRLHLVLGIVHILLHLAYSPLGSLSMNDFRRQQFVIVNGTLKLTDVDDLGVGEPECITDEECQKLASHFGVKNSSTRVPLCYHFQCVGHNSRLNVWHAGQHFVKLLLPISAPQSLQYHIKELLAAFDFNNKSGTLWDVSHVLHAANSLVKFYKSGVYLKQGKGISKLGFKKLKDYDLPGMFDYPCRHSMSAVNCVMSVFNEEEAAQICAEDIKCKAIVLSQEQTWTGRTVAILKTGSNHPVLKRGFTLLVKQDKVS